MVKLTLMQLKQGGKLLFGRMFGVKYGAVQFENAPWKFVRTKRLKGIEASLRNEYGASIDNLSQTQLNGIMSKVQPLHKSPIKLTDNNLSYVNCIGNVQVYNPANNNMSINMVTQLRKPISSWWHSF